MSTIRRASLAHAPYVDDPIVLEEHRVPTATPGISLYLRGKRSSRLETFRSERTVLFLHGSSYPAHTSYDLAHDGLSWLDHLARHGYDAWCVDIRGYGLSTRPAEMEGPPTAAAPVVRTATAVEDVAAAVAFILAHRAVPKLILIGWSWGTSLTGAYTAAHPERVDRLVLLAPQWLRTTPSAADQGGTLGAYRTIARAAAKTRWLKGVPEEKRATILPDDWFDAWADATFATDPWGATQDPPVVRAPNGTVQDSREYWAAGRPFYDPTRIRVPVLAMHGEWDAEFTRESVHDHFDHLVGAPYRRLIEVGEATHSFILEANRWQVLDAVQGFLAEG